MIIESERMCKIKKNSIYDTNTDLVSHQIPLCSKTTIYSSHSSRKKKTGLGSEKKEDRTREEKTCMGQTKKARTIRHFFHARHFLHYKRIPWFAHAINNNNNDA